MSDRNSAEKWRPGHNSPAVEALVRQCCGTRMTPQATEDLIAQAHKDAAYFRRKKVFPGESAK